VNRYVKETARLYAVLDRQLAEHEFIVDQYSIADIACYPWIVPHERQKQSLDDFPNLKRWFEAIQARPATQAAYAKAKEINIAPTVSEQSKQILFGQDAQTVKRSPTDQKTVI
jgi:GST-like protein